MSQQSSSMTSIPKPDACAIDDDEPSILIECESADFPILKKFGDLLKSGVKTIKPVAHCVGPIENSGGKIPERALPTEILIVSEDLPFISRNHQSFKPFVFVRRWAIKRPSHGRHFGEVYQGERHNAYQYDW
jgi:hypothetical protein